MAVAIGLDDVDVVRHANAANPRFPAVSLPVAVAVLEHVAARGRLLQTPYFGFNGAIWLGKNNKER